MVQIEVFWVTVLLWTLQRVFIKEVFSHMAMCLSLSDAGQTWNVVAQLFDGVMAVGEEVWLKKVT